MLLRLGGVCLWVCYVGHRKSWRLVLQEEAHMG